MKYILQLALLLVVTTVPRYYGYSQKNAYNGYNFYSANKTFVGQSRTDLRGGYRYVDSNKIYQGYSRGGDGKTYLPAVVK